MTTETMSPTANQAHLLEPIAYYGALSRTKSLHEVNLPSLLTMIPIGDLQLTRRVEAGRGFHGTLCVWRYASAFPRPISDIHDLTRHYADCADAVGCRLNGAQARRYDRIQTNDPTIKFGHRDNPEWVDPGPKLFSSRGALHTLYNIRWLNQLMFLEGTYSTNLARTLRVHERFANGTPPNLIHLPTNRGLGDIAALRLSLPAATPHDQ